MRQLYDHFFSLVAPDDAVRKSPVFHVKSGDKPMQVQRRERLEYAASLVRDKRLSELLLAEVNEVLDVYQQLNMIHARHSLDRARAKATLLAMQQVIQQWMDALEL
jgi:hypothetical protein